MLLNAVPPETVTASGASIANPANLFLAEAAAANFRIDLGQSLIANATISVPLQQSTLDADVLARPAAVATIYRLHPNHVSSSKDIRSIFTDYKGDDKELVVFVLPHDDDGIIGAGLTLVNLIKAGVPVAIIVATDGGAGYCSEKERNKIVKTRLHETMNSFSALGINVDDGLSPTRRFFGKCAQKILPFAAKFLSKGSTKRLFEFAYENHSSVRFLNIPDGGTNATIGKKFEQAMVRAIRKGFEVDGIERQPTRIIYPTGNDAHPDHKNTAMETLISLFHSQGKIWSDICGDRPLGAIPEMLEMMVYCKVPSERRPEILVHGTKDDQQKVIAGLYAYESQLANIAGMVERVNAQSSEFLTVYRAPLFNDGDREEFMRAFTSRPLIAS